MNQPLSSTSRLVFASLEETVRILPGIIRTFPEDCQEAIRSLTQAIINTAMKEQVAAEPRVPPFDLSRFPKLHLKSVSQLSPAEAQYVLRATVSLFFVNTKMAYDDGDTSSAHNGYAQTLQALWKMWELTPEMAAYEANATANVLKHL